MVFRNFIIHFDNNWLVGIIGVRRGICQEDVHKFLKDFGVDEIKNDFRAELTQIFHDLQIIETFGKVLLAF